MSEQPVLTDATVIALVGQYGDGATGRDLLTSLVSAGYETREAQRFIQRNLDRKTIILGPGLRIYSPPPPAGSDDGIA